MSKCGWLAVSLPMALACVSTRASSSPPGAVDAATNPIPNGSTTCDGTRDMDHDGIADALEGPSDIDGDAIPNWLDVDSDGDGVSDTEEAAGGPPCNPRDTDEDGIGDFRDNDTDNDGVSDADEARLGTNPRAADSDGDGIPDPVEVAARTNPLDRTSSIPPTDFYVVLPYQGEPVSRALRFDTRIRIADVFFLVDMTGSMRGVRETIITKLVDTLIPGIEDAISDVQMGVGGYDDYPVPPYGSGTDRPFYLLREIAPMREDRGAWSTPAHARFCPYAPEINDIGTIVGAPNGRPDLLEAVEGLPCHGGGDSPESSGPALHATATGRGLEWPGGSIPDRVCPAAPDDISPRRGYPCFRPDALPIIVLFGDSPFHNGAFAPNHNPYEIAAPAWADVVASLDEIGARVITIANPSVIYDTGRGVIPLDFSEISRATGAVRADGSPLAFLIEGSGAGLDRAVVEAVSLLVGGTPQDVNTRTENVAGNPDDFDATRFIASVTPVEGYNGSATGAQPGVTYARKDETTFYEVIPGTEVEFNVTFSNTVRPSDYLTRVFRARIAVMGNRVARLQTRQVYIVVPPNFGPVLL